MVYVLAFVTLLLTAAVIVLFAMLGELYARVGPATGSAARPLDGAGIGQRPDVWPAELDRLATAEDAVLLVLSTACNSCARVASQLRDRPDPVDGHDTGVVLSTADPERAEAFMRQHGLARDSVFVDVGGTWVSGAFGVQTSPAALVLQAGLLTAAHIFTDVAALPAAVVPAKEAV